MRNAALALLFTLPVLAACASPIVGGNCESGYTNCHGACIDTRTDPHNCGACGQSCPAAAPFCSTSICVVDAGLPDLGTDAGTEMGPRDLGVDLSFDGGYHMPPCDLGEIRCGAVCVPATRDPRHCGSCTTVCTASEVCAAGTCRPACDPPLTTCGTECIDTTTDARNCMTCGNACASGICLDSMCSAGRVGHVVLIGHDYANSIPDEDKVVGNAVLIGGTSTVRLLTFQGSARPLAVAGADNAVNTVATARSVTIMRTNAVVADQVPLLLASADVFLVYAQRDAIDSDLTAEGTAWSSALVDFVARGGIVVSLDDDSPTNMGTWQVLTTAGLLNNTSRTTISGTNVHVVAGGDQLATGIGTMYRAQTASVRFDSADSVMVIDDGMGHPVAIHRTITP